MYKTFQAIGGAVSWRINALKCTSCSRTVHFLPRTKIEHRPGSRTIYNQLGAYWRRASNCCPDCAFNHSFTRPRQQQRKRRRETRYRPCRVTTADVSCQFHLLVMLNLHPLALFTCVYRHPRRTDSGTEIPFSPDR